MDHYDSIQELIVKAALYDKVSTTISADEMIGGRDVLKITFSKGDRHSSTCLELRDFKDRESMALWCCKDALLKLLFAPYKEIEVVMEDKR